VKPRLISWKSKRALLPGSGLVFSSALLLAISPTQVRAFSLLGPYEPWMVPQIGFAEPGDIGGPKNLGEEYRWNVPVLTYAFDQSFVDYFGSNGVAAVESAISILNSLPPVSELSVSNYPLAATSFNYQAQAEGLFDLKSQTLALLLEQLGLATPTRFTFCVRSFGIVGGEPQVTVVQRNYDPYAWSPSAQVNDALYGYSLVYSPGSPPTNVDAVEFAIDPTQNMFPAVADGALSAGLLYSGLTRDDVAGLRYLLHTNNRNMEALLADVHGAGTNAGAYVDQAVRDGVDKIVFIRPGYDSLIGQFFVPYTNQFIDTYVTTGAPQQQQLERVVTRPDILFRSADLSYEGSPAPRFDRTGTSNWLSFAAPGAAGPGVIQPRVQITFHRPSSYLQTADSLTDGTVMTQAFQDYGWGSFDISANPPVAYPAGSAPVATNQLTVELELDFANRAVPAFFTWQVPVVLGSQATVQTSTNLKDWVLLFSVTNRGMPFKWRHSVSQAERYFRVVGQ
jgi:hypothetical protein